MAPAISDSLDPKERTLISGYKQEMNEKNVPTAQ
jgi:hypothetical protein